MFFFSSLKLQYRPTIVLLNKFKHLKKSLFQKRRWSCDFLPRKTRLPTSTARFPAKKDGILHSRSGCLGTSLPLPQSLYGRTLTSQPKFFGSTDYQISLAMELRWRALPAGPAIIVRLIARSIASTDVDVRKTRIATYTFCKNET